MVATVTRGRGFVKSNLTSMSTSFRRRMRKCAQGNNINVYFIRASLDWISASATYKFITFQQPSGPKAWMVREFFVNRKTDWSLRWITSQASYFMWSSESKRAADTWSMCVRVLAQQSGLCANHHLISVLRKPCTDTASVWVHGYSDNRFKCLHGSNNTSDGLLRSQQRLDGNQSDLLHKKGAGLRRLTASKGIWTEVLEQNSSLEMFFSPKWDTRRQIHCCLSLTTGGEFKPAGSL